MVHLSITLMGTESNCLQNIAVCQGSIPLAYITKISYWAKKKKEKSWTYEET
jgi:hypothetical protein